MKPLLKQKGPWSQRKKNKTTVSNAVPLRKLKDTNTMLASRERASFCKSMEWPPVKVNLRANT